MKHTVKMPFSWAHRGVQIKDYAPGDKIEGPDDDADLVELVKVGRQEGWIAEEKSRASLSTSASTGRAGAAGKTPSLLTSLSTGLSTEPSGLSSLSTLASTLSALSTSGVAPDSLSTSTSSALSTSTGAPDGLSTSTSTTASTPADQGASTSDERSRDAAPENKSHGGAPETKA